MNFSCLFYKQVTGLLVVFVLGYVVGQCRCGICVALRFEWGL